jgi:hypothetical protein
MGKLGRLKSQMHEFTINIDYAEPSWLMLEAIKNHAQQWNAKGLSPTFWRDEALKILVGVGLIEDNEVADTTEWLQNQSLDYKGVGWALAKCLDEYILVRDKITETFPQWMRVNAPNKIVLAIRELGNKGQGKNPNNNQVPNNNRPSPYGKGGKRGKNNGKRGNGWNNNSWGNNGNNNPGGAKKGGGKKTKGGKGKSNNNTWNTSNGWGNNSWGSADWTPAPAEGTGGANTTDEPKKTRKTR